MPNDLLYHYTSAEGFLGILRDGCIRATNFSFLNDSTEIGYGLDVVIDVLEEVRSSPDPLWIDGNPTDAIRRLEDFRDASEVYVSCFTTLCNDLSQWRAYGNSGGDRYCIGFDRKALLDLELQRPPISRVKILDVEYDRTAQRLAVLNVLRQSSLHGSVPAATALARQRRPSRVQPSQLKGKLGS